MALIKSINLTRESPLEESLRLWNEAEQEEAAEPWDLAALLEAAPAPLAVKDLHRLNPLHQEMQETIKDAKIQFLASERATSALHLQKLEEIKLTMARCRRQYSRELLDLSAAIIQRQEWDELITMYSEIVGMEKLAGTVLREDTPARSIV